ncbi:putative entry exclusion protein TrbK-alt [Mesorhizobium sp. M0276]|uniref:putative entry exclusion protein TrbK-alt n=1 Tax=Mesorhizobium sp. M0276 TaxID=2956928 RepID=UPI00333D6295
MSAPGRGGWFFGGGAVPAPALQLTRKEDRPATSSIGRSEGITADPLRGELIRCQALGEAGTRDSRCLSIWAENRRRFLTPAPPAIDRPKAR